MRIACAILIACLWAGPTYAFDALSDRKAFLDVVVGKTLNRRGITLQVISNGKIAGRAFGGKVTGSWTWEGSNFCRTLYWGRNEIPRNCQAVSVRGNTLRFQADRGLGEIADFRME